MKKVLLVLGLGGLGYGAYWFFNKQLQLALDWDIKMGSIKNLNITSKETDATLSVLIQNKSMFSITVNSYNLKAIYDGNEIGNTTSSTAFNVSGDSWFEVPIDMVLNHSKLKSSLGELGLSILEEKEVMVDVSGVMNVTFQGINRDVALNLKDVIVSENISKDLGLKEPIDKVKDFLGKLGIKV